MIALDILEKSESIRDRQEFYSRLKIYISWQKERLKKAKRGGEEINIEAEESFLSVLTGRLERFNVYRQNMVYKCPTCDEIEAECACHVLTPPRIKTDDEIFQERSAKLF